MALGHGKEPMESRQPWAFAHGPLCKIAARGDAAWRGTKGHHDVAKSGNPPAPHEPRGARLSRGASAQFVRVGVRPCVLAGDGNALSRSKRSGMTSVVERGMWWEARDVGDVTTRPFAPSNSKFSLSAIHICSSSICC
jgi:hypothetical protein